MKNMYVLYVVTENTLRVLQRLAGIFSRQRLNIEHMTVLEMNQKGTSYFNIVVYSEPKTLDRVVKQLQRIVELHTVQVKIQMPLFSSYVGEKLYGNA